MLPSYTHITGPNTFEFFVDLDKKIPEVVVKQTTDFSEDAELHELFPHGSISYWDFIAHPKCKTPIECVNNVAPRLLAEWTPIQSLAAHINSII